MMNFLVILELLWENSLNLNNKFKVNPIMWKKLQNLANLTQNAKIKLATYSFSMEMLKTNKKMRVMLLYWKNNLLKYLKKILSMLTEFVTLRSEVLLKSWKMNFLLSYT